MGSAGVEGGSHADGAGSAAGAAPPAVAGAAAGGGRRGGGGVGGSSTLLLHLRALRSLNLDKRVGDGGGGAGSGGGGGGMVWKVMKLKHMGPAIREWRAVHAGMLTYADVYTCTDVC